MTGVPSTAYNTNAEIYDLARAHLGDRKANVFTNAVLTPFLQAAYRKLQRYLANTGQETFITDEALLVVAALANADASAQASITDATAPPNQLPIDLICPLRVWERPSGSADNFIEVVDGTGRGGLPSYLQGQRLQMWEWRSDGIYFPGALQDVQIRVRYLAQLSANSGDANGQTLIRNAIDAIALYTAYYGARARGAKNTPTLLSDAQDAAFDLRLMATRRDQRKGRRRRPYGRRNSIW